MTPERFHTIEEIFRSALNQEPKHLDTFLDTACEGDEVLRSEVEALLSSREHADGFIETSAFGLATKIIQTEHAHSLVGEMVGHYRISQLLGTGGMGEVYLANDVIADRKAALKLLPFRFTSDGERLKRFQREERAVVGLNHPNILTVYEVGEDHSTHYIASELIEGETLRDRITGGRLQLREAVEIAIQVTSALVAAHDAGVVHRDIKPENIMLRPDGYVKVLDFGIAKLGEQELPVTTSKAEALLLVETNLGSILGTARYMSPEQARGAQVDKRTDIWSLGVVLYEMVTGHTPFTGDTPADAMTAILEQEPPPLANYLARAPAEFQQIINKTLRKVPDERYQDAHELLDALKDLRRKLEARSERAAAPLWLRWARSPVAVLLVVIGAALAVAVSLNWNRKPMTSPPIDKSIAVLPFENLSKDEENAFFAGGVQDEILTNLSKIADLKVTSRTSVMKYKSDLERNVREIAKSLGVSHVVEGSVQRGGARIRVNVQLIDARNDAHLWAEHYDRESADLFAIQSEIAERIANQLRANLSVTEKAAIEERPTADSMAYAYYAQAKAIADVADWEASEKSVNRQVDLLEKATRHDPSFALAYCALARAQCDLFSSGGPELDSSRTHLDLAKKAADEALRLRPDLGEAHLELARYSFLAGDPDHAVDELAVARRKLPNNADVYYIAARIDRRQNRWNSAVINLQKANDLDPRNSEFALCLGETYFEMRRYSEWEQLISKWTSSGITTGLWIQSNLAQIKLAQGNPAAAQSVLDQVPLDFTPTETIWNLRFNAALYLRDYDGTNGVIASMPAKLADRFPFRWITSPDGLVARARGDEQKARSIFLEARKRLDATWGIKVKDATYFALAAELDAGLGKKEEAIREGQRAVELLPITKDSLQGPGGVYSLALVYAWTGEHNRAFEQLESIARIPAGPPYGDLLLNPCWDDLRSDPRFDKIVAIAKAASK